MVGHERIGVLPKSRRWRQIVIGIENSGDGRSSADAIAAQTLSALGQRYANLAKDPSVEEAFSFLLDIAIESRSEASTPESRSPSVHSPLTLVREFSKRLDRIDEATETREIVRFALADTLAIWTRDNSDFQQPLLALAKQAGPWARTGTTAGFCEISRLFLSRLTTRYLNYFLDREASAAISDMKARNQFQSALQNHVEQVSRWSFESAKIAQSFAAGWFTKHASTGKPDTKTRRAFLAYAFEKLRDEFRRENP